LEKKNLPHTPSGVNKKNVRNNPANVITKIPQKATVSSKLYSKVSAGNYYLNLFKLTIIWCYGSKNQGLKNKPKRKKLEKYRNETKKKSRAKKRNEKKRFSNPHLEFFSV
jgi:hypothetical protein